MSRYHDISSYYQCDEMFGDVNSILKSFPPPMCYCKMVALVYTSNTMKNPKKQFYGCPYYKEVKKYCVKFFLWVEDSERIQSMKKDNGMDHTIDIHELQATVMELKLMIKEHVIWSIKALILVAVFSVLVCFFIIYMFK